MAEKTAWRRVAKIARGQHSLITTAQAEGVGVPRSTLARWVAAGRMARWYEGVYALPGVADSWIRRAKAATLAVPTVTRVAAPRLLEALLAEPPIAASSLPRLRTCYRTAGSAMRPSLRRSAARPTSVAPVTSVARTIIDLAAEVTRKRLADILYDAWRRGLTTPLEVAACLGEVGRVRGAATLRRVLAGADPALARTRSIAEIVGFLAIRDAGLPVPVVSHRVETAGRRYELDYAWPETAKALEVDGKAWHSIEPDVAADRSRQSDLEAAGWHIDRAPASLVLTDPDAFVAQVRAHLAAPAPSMSR